jgi:hypothetical protein
MVSGRRRQCSQYAERVECNTIYADRVSGHYGVTRLTSQARTAHFLYLWFSLNSWRRRAQHSP